MLPSCWLGTTNEALITARDAAVVAVAVTGVAAGAQGVRCSRMEPEGPIPLEDGSEPATDASLAESRAKRRLSVIGSLHLRLGAGPGGARRGRSVALGSNHSDVAALCGAVGGCRGAERSAAEQSTVGPCSRRPAVGHRECPAAPACLSLDSSWAADSFGSSSSHEPDGAAPGEGPGRRRLLRPGQLVNKSTDEGSCERAMDEAAGQRLEARRRLAAARGETQVRRRVLLPVRRPRRPRLSSRRRRVPRSRAPRTQVRRPGCRRAARRGATRAGPDEGGDDPPPGPLGTPPARREQAGRARR